MAEFKSELPEDVGVETVTFIAYEDNRPTEVVMAGTSDEHVLHCELNEIGMAGLSDFLAWLGTNGLVR